MIESQKFTRRIIFATIFIVSVSLITIGSLGIAHISKISQEDIPTTIHNLTEGESITYDKFRYIVLIVMGGLFLIINWLVLPRIFKKAALYSEPKE